MLAKRDGTQRIALSRIQAYPDLQWHDNDHLFSLYQTTENSHLKTELRKWNIHSRKYETIPIPGTPTQQDGTSGSRQKQLGTEHSFLVTSPPQKNNYLLSQINRWDAKHHVFSLSIIQAIQDSHPSFTIR